MSERNCGNCSHAFMDVAPSKDLQRFCRRFPPIVSAVAIPVQTPAGLQMAVQNVTAFPLVRDDWHCGEHQSKVLAS